MTEKEENAFYVICAFLYNLPDVPDTKYTLEITQGTVTLKVVHPEGSQVTYHGLKSIKEVSSKLC